MITERPGLRPKTVELYSYLLRRHLAPKLGQTALADIKAAQVRSWRKGLLDSGTSPVTAAKAYRLLKAILNTALNDGAIRRNPCRIKGAAQEESPERPTLTIGQVYALADATDQRNTLASTSTGATLRELMDRMGHDSERAAMVYLHGSDERQHQIADTLSKITRDELKRGSKRPDGQASGKRSGTQRARNRKQAS